MTRDPDAAAWRPRIQLGVLATAPRVGAGQYLAMQSLPPAAAYVVTWSASDQAEPEMASLRGDGAAERLERPGGGYIGFASTPGAGELLISNATDADIEDVQVLGVRSSAPLALRALEPVYRPGEPASAGGPSGHSPAPQTH